MSYAEIEVDLDELERDELDDEPSSRMWATDEQPATLPPIVLVSSRDNHPAPTVRGMRALVEYAERHGWSARITYALARVPDRFYGNGRLAKADHELASVALRFARGVERGFAVWHNADGAGWRFAAAWFGSERRWLQSGKGKRPTMAARLARPVGSHVDGPAVAS